MIIPHNRACKNFSFPVAPNDLRQLPGIRPRLWDLGAARLLLQDPDQLTGIKADRGGNIEVFQNVQPALPQLVFGNVGGRLTQSLRQHDLRHASSLATLDQQLAQPSMTFGVEGFRQLESRGRRAPQSE
jgi:hypothetical protein